MTYTTEAKQIGSIELEFRVQRRSVALYVHEHQMKEWKEYKEENYVEYVQSINLQPDVIKLTTQENARLAVCDIQKIRLTMWMYSSPNVGQRKLKAITYRMFYHE